MFADMQIDQIYRNNTGTPIETVYLLPKTDSFSLRRIEAIFYDSNGNKLTELETKIFERKEGLDKYKTALEKGETATLAETSEKYFVIYLGNFPANTKAHLRAYCS
jgi:hypothetical protein